MLSRLAAPPRLFGKRCAAVPSVLDTQLGAALNVGATRFASSNPLPEKADVVIIGGGVVGCGAARAFAKMGQSNVVVLEQNTLTSGTTWHAAGLVASLKGSMIGADMVRKSMEFFDTFPATDVGYHNTGSLGLARNEVEMLYLRRLMAVGHQIGLPHREVSVDEIKELHPFLNLDGVVGGVYSPQDGIINPADLSLHMMKEATASGAKRFENVRVTGFDFDGPTRTVKGVHTTAGSIQCEQVLISAGGWSKQLVKMALGDDIIPTAQAPHQYICFNKIEGVGNHLPVVRDYSNKYYLKPEVGGFMVGVFEGDPVPHLPDSVQERNMTEMPHDIPNEVFGEDFDKAGHWLEAAMETVPVLQDTGIKSSLHGPDTHSGDHGQIMGRLPGSENLFIATGFNSQGIQMGPAAGQAMAEWMTDGYPQSFQTDFCANDVLRFFPELGRNKEWCANRALEGYGRMFGVHRPFEQFESSRGLNRQTPLHDRLAAAGGVFGEGFGWERAFYFMANASERENAAQDTHFAEEVEKWSARGKQPEAAVQRVYATGMEFEDCEFAKAVEREAVACRTKCAIFDLSPFGKLHVTGKNALDLLQRTCTSDIASMEVGQAKYTLMCDENGGIVADLTVARTAADEYYLVTIATQPLAVYDHLDRHTKKAGDAPLEARVVDGTCDRGVLAVMGPNSRKLLEPLVEPGALEDEVFPPYGAKPLRVSGVDCLALRVSFAGELGWELHAPSEQCSSLHEKLFQASADTEAGLVNAGSMALLESLRLEKGFIHYGHEVSQDQTPYDVGLGFAVDLKKPVPFVGQQALAKAKEGRAAAPEVSRMVIVTMPGASKQDAGWGHGAETLLRDGQPAGYLTSAGYSFALGCPIGMGFVKGPASTLTAKELQKSQFEVEQPYLGRDGQPGGFKRLEAKASLRAPFDPKGSRMRGDYSDEYSMLRP
eukprot:TRINITY_DN7037_c0_g1_i2.p1 TRINITY_DN7037_c0_g1~~TRINITY_DN7037_c0_g1_i2.p1  ORF type:complete len:939 (+),score=185.39 TRINITY_DN7037_c0_g1_i2:138-2954(+)